MCTRAGGGAADQQRNVEALALHFGGDERHLVERGRDEAGEADDVDLLLLGLIEDALRRHHHAEIDDLEIVAGEHDADDVLADVVHVALHRGEQDFSGVLPLVALGLAGLDIGQQIGHRRLHHARRLHHLRQKHLSRAEQVADLVHAGHQRAFDHVERARRTGARLFDVGVDEIGHAIDEGIFKPRLDARLAPGGVLLTRLSRLAAILLGERQQALGGVGTAVEHHVLAGLAQFRIDLLIDRELAGVDDAHVHADGDGVIEEHAVHRLAHGLVAAKRERQIAHAAGDMGVGQLLADFARGLDEIDAVMIVLLDAGRDREHIGIEDDVLGREADLLGQDLVSARADLDLACEGVGLALFVEGHDHGRRAVAAHDLGLFDEFGLALLHRNRIDRRLALKAFQAGLDHFEFRGIDHHRHARDIRLGGDEIEKLDHDLLRIQQALVHVDVDDLRAIGDLVARDLERGRIVAGLDQLAEFRRAGDIGALADVHEIDVGRQRERLEAREPQQRLDDRNGRAASRRRRAWRWRGYAPAWCRSSRRRH